MSEQEKEPVKNPEVVAPENKQSGVIKQELELTQHRGPLPDPETLGLYEKYLPGLANRIVTMAEKEQDNSHTKDREEHTIKNKAVTVLIIYALAPYVVGIVSLFTGQLTLSLVSIGIGLGFSSINIVSIVYQRIKASNGNGE